MYGRIYTYTRIEDAWHSGLYTWFLNASQKYLAGREFWFVVPTRSIAHWIRQRLASQGHGLLGVRIMTAPELLRELSVIHKLSEQFYSIEFLEFLLQAEIQPHYEKALEAAELTGDKSLANTYLWLQRNSRPLFQAIEQLFLCDQLDRSHLQHLVPAALIPWFEKLKNSPHWRPAVKKHLVTLKEHSSPNLEICCFGWDASYSQEFYLLLAAAQTADACFFYFPNPGVNTAEEAQQKWIERFEQLPGFRQEASPTADLEAPDSPHQKILDALWGASTTEGTLASLPPEERPIHFLKCNTPEDQIFAVGQKVQDWLQQSSLHDRMAIIVPQAGITSLSIAKHLQQLNITCFHESGGRSQPPLETQVYHAITDYFYNNCDFHSLEALIRLLNQLAPKDWKNCPIQYLHQWGNDANSYLQISDCRILAQHPLPKTTHAGYLQAHQSIQQLIQILQPPSPSLSWTQFLNFWQNLASALNLSVLPIEFLKSQVLQDALDQKLLNSTLILRWMRNHLANTNALFRSQDTNETFARVVITTPENAIGTPWSALIYMDSHDNGWPATRKENPFLPDKNILTLKDTRPPDSPPILTSIERSEFDYGHFFEQLLNAKGSATFSWAVHPDASSTEQQPNEIVLRLLPLTGTDASSLITWRSLPSIAEEPAFPRLRSIREKRLSPTTPYDEFLFNFGPELRLETPVSPSRLDAAFNTSATFALQYLFRSESRLSQDLSRTPFLITGTLVHQWISTLLAPCSTTSDFRNLQTTQFAELRQSFESQLQHCYQKVGRSPGYWWSSLLDKAESITSLCLKHLCNSIQQDYHFASEYPFKGTISTPLGNLPLRGRLDLLMSPSPEFQNAELHIVDFKTGNKEIRLSLKDLFQGKGNQFLTYSFLFKNHSPHHDIRIDAITPMGAFIDLTHDLPAGPVEYFAWMYHQGMYGQTQPITGKSYSFNDKETLPLATLPIPPAVLQEKCKLRNQAFLNACPNNSDAYSEFLA